MGDASTIKEHMEVIGADGGHIGTVDHVDSGKIKLTKTDVGSGGKHHYLPLGLIADVEGDKVRTSFNAELATDFWEEADA